MVRTREPERFGGVIDTRTYDWYDESPNPVVWLVSEEQRRLILHGDDLPLQIVCEGAEGAGKTTGVLARWNLLRAIERAGKNLEFGCVAPTQARLERVRQALAEAMPPEWYSYRQRDWLFRFALGHQLRLVSAHRASEAEGSPVQGYDWAGASGDEVQDQLHIVDDVVARGRRAGRGRYKVMFTASVKDSAKYRQFRTKWAATRNRSVVRLAGVANPYVPPEHWQNLREQLDDRAYRRRVLAEFVGPERKTYPDFERPTHVIPIPVTARDVTHHAVGIYESYQRHGAVFRMGAGHDPGKIKNTSVLHRAFLFPGKPKLLTWMVVGEFITERTTQENHAAELRKHLQKEYDLEVKPDRFDPSIGLEKCLIFRDPHGRGEQHPDEDVEGAFRRHGFDIFSAAPDKQVIKRRTRIEMMNRLILYSPSRRIRFCIACTDAGVPLAPETLRLFEEQERDELENPETLKKGALDITHPAVACGYFLWPFEREEVSAWTHERVLSAAGII